MMTKKEIKIIRSALAQIKPKQLDMNTFGRMKLNGKIVACLAGHICLFQGYEMQDDEETGVSFRLKNSKLPPRKAHEIVKKLLKLSDKETDVLFYTCEWPELFSFEYSDLRPRKRLEVLKSRVEHFINTGK